MKAIQILVAAIVAAAAAQAQAEGMSMAMPMGKADAAAKKEVPFVKADVVKADASKGRVTLKHEDVPNLNMPGMTMAFPVANKKLLNGVKTGDKVRVKFEMVKGQTTVTALEAAK